jgi:UDP-glucose 4-epimerase
MTSVLVTGGAGYIGSHAVLALVDAGLTPVVIDNLTTGVRSAVPSGVAFQQGDIADKAFVKRVLAEHGISAVMHFAGSISVAESVRDPAKYYRNNVAGSLALIETCLGAGVQNFIFSSSAAVYGVPETLPVTEDSPKQPINPYGASKLMTERMLFDVAAAHPAFRPVCLRYFNVAGADPHGRSGQQGPESTHLIRAAVEAAVGTRAVLEVYGQDYETRDGTCERDYVHVSDLAAAHLSALRYLQAGGAPVALNCGYGRGFTVLEVIAETEKVLGRPLPVRHGPRRPGDPPRLVSSAEKIGHVLGWKPERDSLAEMISSALAWQEKLVAAA